MPQILAVPILLAVTLTLSACNAPGPPSTGGKAYYSSGDSTYNCSQYVNPFDCYQVRERAEIDKELVTIKDDFMEEVDNSLPAMSRFGVPKEQATAECRFEVGKALPYNEYTGMRYLSLYAQCLEAKGFDEFRP